MKVTFIRHTSVSVETGICYGQSNVDVSTTFGNEAKIVKSKLENKQFDAVYSSPLQRCTKLASFCGYSSPTLDSRLMELNFGAWEMKAWTDINDPQLQNWFDNWATEIPTHGESFFSMTERVGEFLEDVKKLHYNHIAVFAHAGVIRSAGIIAEHFTVEQAFDYKVEYGDLFEIEL